MVSNNGSTLNRMAYYNKKLIVHNDINSYTTVNENEISTAYFCPISAQQQYNGEHHYNDMRTFPRHAYHPYDKDLIWHVDQLTTFKPSHSNGV